MVASNALNISEGGFQSFDGVSLFKGRTLQEGTGITITNADGISGDPVISASASGSKVWFASNASIQVDGVTGDGTEVTILFPNAAQSGTDYNPATGVFTCSEANQYFFNSSVGFLGLDATNTNVRTAFKYTNIGSGITQRFYFSNLPALSITDTNTAGLVTGSVLLPMSVGDTVSIIAQVFGVTKNVGILGQYNIDPELYTYFSATT